MAALDNITVADADLKKIFTDIDDYKFEGQTDFSEDIKVVKRDVYRDLSRQTGLKDSELANIKDYTIDTSLYDKIIYLTLSNILANNSRMELASHYKSRGEAIAFEYYIDENTDNVIDESEKRLNNRIKFGR